VYETLVIFKRLRLLLQNTALGVAQSMDVEPNSIESWRRPRSCLCIQGCRRYCADCKARISGVVWPLEELRHPIKCQGDHSADRKI